MCSLKSNNVFYRVFIFPTPRHQRRYFISIIVSVFKYHTQTIYLNMCYYVFDVSLTVHLDMNLVNNQLDAQFFMYIYFYSLHVSGSHMPIIRRIIVSTRHLYVTLCRWPSGMQEHILLHTCTWKPYSTITTLKSLGE